MVRKFIIFLAFVLLLFLFAELFSLWGQKSGLDSQYDAAKVKFEAAKNQRDQLQGDLLRLKNPVNLEKELRDRLHYQSPGEKVIILVPGESSTTP